MDPGVTLKGATVWVFFVERCPGGSAHDRPSVSTVDATSLLSDVAVKLPLLLDQDWLFKLLIFSFFVCGRFLFLIFWQVASIVDAVKSFLN